MMTSYFDNLEFYMFSPLDQFGDDDNSTGLSDNMLTDLIPSVWRAEELLDFIGIGEVDSIIDWATVLLTTSGTTVFDDEDAGDIESAPLTAGLNQDDL